MELDGKQTHTSAPPLPPPLPPRPEVSDDSSDDTVRAENKVSEQTNNVGDSGEVAHIRMRISQLRNVAQSFKNTSAPLNKKALTKFHSNAMRLMDSAANASYSLPPSKLPNPGSPGRYTALRIRRDKQRLEQHYLATMSFLDRADAGDSSVLVEEIELEGDAASVATDKRQLQSYALEAMSFLEKAFNLDESILVDDDNSDSCRSPIRMSPDAASIEHDRAELARYAEKYGEFLEKALEGDSVIDDRDSESHITARSPSGKDVTSAEGFAINEFSESVNHLLAPVQSKPSIASDNRASYLEPTTVESTLVSDEVAHVHELPRRGGNRCNRQVKDRLNNSTDNSFNQTGGAKPYPRDVLPPTVDVIVTGLTGSSQELRGVPLHGSFFRKLPRGSTVQIEPTQSSATFRKASGLSSEALPTEARGDDIIAKERDALIELLQEILNERSTLAVRVGEMKQMMMHARGNMPATFATDVDDINLSDDLCMAYETMRTMTEETEETINFLEAKHQKACAENYALESEIRDLKSKLRNEDFSAVSYMNSELCEPSEMNPRTSWETELFLMQQYTVQREIEMSQLLRNRDEDEKMKLEVQFEKVRDLSQNLQLTVASKDAELVELGNKLNRSKSMQHQNSVTITQLREEISISEASVKEAKHLSAELSNELDRLRASHSQLQRKYNELHGEKDLLQVNFDKLKGARDNLQSMLVSARGERDKANGYISMLASKEEECKELQRRLTELEHKARVREEQMRRQMRELKEHADRAVAAAALAEQNAGHAAATASTARSNAQAQIESERASRCAIERKLEEKIKELAVKESEVHAWETYARERAEHTTDTSESSLSKSSSLRAISNLVASGSRRAVGRKDPDISYTSGVPNSSRLSSRDRVTGPVNRQRWEAASITQSEDEKNRRKPHRRFFS